jgi:small acid-soluble spore protein F (minor alpha/beta-type SASP)
MLWLFLKLQGIVKKKEGIFMGRRRGIMSEQFKEELARDLGFYDTLKREGWGGITTRDAGNMVKRAIQIAEEAMAKGEKH